MGAMSEVRQARADVAWIVAVALNLGAGVALRMVEPSKAAERSTAKDEPTAEIAIDSAASDDEAPPPPSAAARAFEDRETNPLPREVTKAKSSAASRADDALIAMNTASGT